MYTIKGLKEGGRLDESVQDVPTQLLFIARQSEQWPRLDAAAMARLVEADRYVYCAANGWPSDYTNQLLQGIPAFINYLKNGSN